MVLPDFSHFQVQPGHRKTPSQGAKTLRVRIVFFNLMDKVQLRSQLFCVVLRQCRQRESCSQYLALQLYLLDIE